MKAIGAEVKRAIRVVCRTASRLSIYKPETGATLAWELCSMG
jgi:hypothetical protein